jgi:hypothetical protein
MLSAERTDSPPTAAMSQINPTIVVATTATETRSAID